MINSNSTKNTQDTQKFAFFSLREILCNVSRPRTRNDHFVAIVMLLEIVYIIISLFVANEYRNWLLFYGAPVLNQILPKKYFHHFLLLIKATYLCLQQSISQEDLKEAEFGFSTFVYFMNSLYGDRYCSANVHALLHIVRSVRIHGPMWASLSGFVYENWNGDFKNMFHGTQDIEKQVRNFIFSITLGIEFWCLFNLIIIEYLKGSYRAKTSLSNLINIYARIKNMIFIFTNKLV